MWNHVTFAKFPSKAECTMKCFCEFEKLNSNSQTMKQLRDPIITNHIQSSQWRTSWDRPTVPVGGTIFLSDEMIRQYQAKFRAIGKESFGSFLEEKELKAWQKPNLECQNPLNQWNGLKCIESVNQSVLVRFKMIFWGWVQEKNYSPCSGEFELGLNERFGTCLRPDPIRRLWRIVAKKIEFIFGSQKSKSFLKVIDQLSFSLEDPKKTAVGSTFAWPGVWDNMQDGKCRRQSLFEIGQCQNISCRFI